MSEPIATPEDVRVEVNTDLEDGTITSILERVARDNDRVNNVERMDDSLRTDLEAALAALHISESRDRAIRQKSIGNASKSYETNSTDGLKRRIRLLDPSNGAVMENRNQWTVTSEDV